MSILCSCIMETKVIPVLIVEVLNLSGGRQMAHVGINDGIREWSCWSRKSFAVFAAEDWGWGWNSPGGCSGHP